MPVENVVTVTCTGNTCRSPMFEACMGLIAPAVVVHSACAPDWSGDGKSPNPFAVFAFRLVASRRDFPMEAVDAAADTMARHRSRSWSEISPSELRRAKLHIGAQEKHADSTRRWLQQRRDWPPVEVVSLNIRDDAFDVYVECGRPATLEEDISERVRTAYVSLAEAIFTAARNAALRLRTL